MEKTKNNESESIDQVLKNLKEDYGTVGSMAKLKAS